MLIALLIVLAVLSVAAGFASGVLYGVRHQEAITDVVDREVKAIQTALTAPEGGPACAVCQRPANVVRFHDGRYLCPRCKAAG